MTSTRSQAAGSNRPVHRRRAPEAFRKPSWRAAALVYLAVRGVGLAVLTVFALTRPPGSETLRGVLAKWDGEWMLALAEHGYRGVPSSLTDAHGVHTAETGYAFFPGYPAVVGLVARIPGVSYFGAAWTLNLVFGVIAAVGIARLGALCVARGRPAGDPVHAGLILVMLFAAAPMAVVLNMAYTEALFCMLAAWALLFVLEHRWIEAGLCALAVGLVRPTGIAVIVVVMLAALLAHRDGPRAAAAFVLAPLGYLGFLGYVAVQTGSLTGWFRIQTAGWDTRFDFGAASLNFLHDAFTAPTTLADVVTGLVMVLTVGLLVWSVFDRLPWPVLLYGALVVASILLSSGLMMSRARLLLPAFVLLIPVAALLSRARPIVAGTVLVPMIAASAVFGGYMLTVFQYAI
ncbi:MAG: hypothetical protein QM774_10115 [Gordonia sp. (in: high G+C Gram-positive bacteria)]|uniref:hypothetical protein n=1 Tax=Gordonia sp. (in: high G+C Gram-positive bacteria) TaxID=84139 RepID=UPI0039E4F1B7